MPDDLPFVTANEFKLEQVFINLIQNSIDALTGQQFGEIDISAETTDNLITIFYQDNGPGFT